MSQSDLSALPALPRDEGGPVFAEPWEAQAFAMAVRLSAAGYFTWKEWAATLAEELKAAVDRGEPDDGTRYYHHWLAALERVKGTQRGLGRGLPPHSPWKTCGASGLPGLSRKYQPLAHIIGFRSVYHAEGTDLIRVESARYGWFGLHRTT